MDRLEIVTRFRGGCGQLVRFHGDINGSAARSRFPHETEPGSISSLPRNWYRREGALAAVELVVRLGAVCGECARLRAGG